jgi:hypothetical protein
VASVVMVLFGASLLVVNTVEVVQGAGRISALRAHGRRVPGEAEIVTACSTSSKSGASTCSTSTVWLSFRDAHGLDQYVAEPRLAHSLYVPGGSADSGGTVHTTVVYDPADPDENAQAVGALRWNAWDLVAHRWLPFTLGLVLTAAGAGALVTDLVDRRGAAASAATA